MNFKEYLNEDELKEGKFEDVASEILKGIITYAPKKLLIAVFEKMFNKQLTVILNDSSNTSKYMALNNYKKVWNDMIGHVEKLKPKAIPDMQGFIKTLEDEIDKITD